MRVKDYTKIDIIYKASLSIIMQAGIAGLTMSKLAKEAQVATGTLYIYFKNKEELINSLYKHLKDKSEERFMKGYKPEAPFKSGLKTVWLNYLKHRIEHYEESIFLEQYYRSPYISAEQLQQAESLKHPVHRVIQRGKKEMLVKQNVDDELLFLSLLGIIRELADEHMMRVYKLDDKRIETAFQLSWDLIKQ